MGSPDSVCSELELVIEVELWQVCYLCKMVFDSKTLMESHNASVHPGLSYVSKSTYLDALMQQDLEADSWICGSVNYDKLNRTSGSTHGTNSAGKRQKKFQGSYSDEKFVCDICQKQFSRRSSLRKHIRFHNEGKIIVCHCGMTFRKNHRYLRHARKCMEFLKR